MVVHIPGQRFFAHVRRGQRVGQNGLAGNLHLVDHRIEHFARQIAAQACHGRAHIFQRQTRIAFQAKLGGDNHAAFLDLRVQVFQALCAGQRIFDLARHLGFHLVGRCARQGSGDRHHRQINVREHLDFHVLEGHDTQKSQHHKSEYRRNRVLDSPGRNVHRTESSRSEPFAPSPAGGGRLG